MVDLANKAWSPYLAGGLIGLLQIPAFLLLGTALGTSSSYVSVAASLAAFADPGLRGLRYAAAHIEGAKAWWQVALVAGIAVGALISATLSGMRRHGIAPVWHRAARLGAAGRFGMAFAGGFVMLLGARIADGCTSGHGLSGLAQLAIGSMIAVAAMFAGGIATAMLFRPVR
ncbi:YeeE/YedE thiosulfate transporter family protein [Roseomonas sp. E05]|uniref:YeeE/YedE thiosulfate transporter family protein n=1 Tax=Roseomonas sp. E05 TaxID=3046310 RepID=UPI0024BB80CC|nr:YeeE/YedE thiosulfate transporter family protein [Roseomonas sp. E05]MDJ0389510.1 YeeE/YedE thiosulfate transporter family protein [Roseomonas sp. E05]